MKYRCVSKIILGQPCGENCQVETPFKPRGCLKTCVYEDWEEAEG